MAQATLTISSKNYSSWSLRGWLLCKLAGLDFEEKPVSMDDPDTRQELLLLSPTVRVPRLAHDGVEVWDTLAIANYLHDTFPDAGMFPEDRKARAHCRAISGEMHSGFFNLRSALPMNIKARHAKFKVFSGARPDIAHVKEIWSQCLDSYGGPFLFGAAPSVADAMFAPVCTRFRTYAVELEPKLQAYCDTIFAWAPMQEWEDAAKAEPDEMAELEVEF
ncbi:glutathione S-transferase family protein [Mangrovicoccus ximenensis]|uniref:glutathione S-transferase family protein n=1 Tax=Mangrovicoccus ximenensis TaxID=1911570 RepID=UPI000D33CAB6|nr:glutathione S-transferase family protein [Mangrovicoccus ximenensis]